MEGVGWTAATLLCQDADFWLAWPRPSRGNGLRSIGAASGVPEPPSVHAGGWMSPARGRQSPSTDLSFFAWASSSLAFPWRVRTAFPRAIIVGSPRHALQRGARVSRGRLCTRGPGSHQEPQPSSQPGRALCKCSANCCANQDVLLLRALLRGSSKTPRGAWTPQLAPRLDTP